MEKSGAEGGSGSGSGRKKVTSTKDRGVFWQKMNKIRE